MSRISETHFSKPLISAAIKRLDRNALELVITVPSSVNRVTGGQQEIFSPLTGLPGGPPSTQYLLAKEMKEHETEPKSSHGR